MINYINNFKVIFFFFLFFFAFSCDSSFSKEKEYNKTYDIPLMNEIHRLRALGNYETIISTNKKYCELAEKNGYMEGKAHCYVNYALLNITQGDFKNSLFLLKRSEDILKNSKNNLLKALLYKAYSELFTSLNQYNNALIINGKSLYYTKKISESEAKDFLTPKLYATRGEILANKNQDSALVYYHKAIKLQDTPLYNGIISMYHLNNMHNKDSAAIYINRSLIKIQSEEKIKPSHIIVYLFAGNYYAQIGDFTKAERFYKKALQANITNKKTSLQYLPKVYYGFAHLYRKIGNKSKKYFYLEKYSDIQNRLNEIRYETINLATEKIISDIRLEENKRAKYIWIYICTLSLILIILGIYISRQMIYFKTKSKEKRNEIKKLKDKIYDNTFEEVKELAIRNDSCFLIRFQELYPSFTENLLKINPKLKNTELIFCAMIKLNFSSKEIANYLTIQHKSVQTRKNRIRSRLNIKSDVDLYLFFSNL